MSDDLDAFFDEVSDVEAKVKAVEENDTPAPLAEEETRPAKKAKPNIPRGVVVAAASSVMKQLPPSVEASNNEVSSSSNGGATFAVTAQQELSVPASLSKKETPKNTIGPAIPSSPNKSSTDAHHKTKQDTSTSTQAIDTTGDFRLFVGNLAAEVTETDLYQHFCIKYPSLMQAQIMRNALGESKGFGFVGFKEALECARAKREMDQSWLGARPIRIKKYNGQQMQHQKQHHGKKKHKR
jgi:RNA recognition motif-containing protein